ncbi:MAG: molybdenum cofactor biosynthesis protein MoaE [Candidatus Bathyarchaeota archaeon]|nr:MAG: molybdenum cofactor biosynthesis protein MoaE [Candidatus Bathyarchaeota archaeon]
MIEKSGVHEKGTIKLVDIIESAKSSRSSHKAGAIALFIGVVRGETEDQKVTSLELEAYKEKANAVLEGICGDLREKEGIVDVQIHHFVGKFEVGDDLLYVLVSGAHRSSVFPTLQEAVERYKKEVPIFKKESIVDDEGKKRSYWVSEQEKFTR